MPKADGIKDAWVTQADDLARVPLGGKLLSYSLMGMVAVFLLWSYFFTIDSVIVVTGKVIPSGMVRQVQHLEGGIVRHIRKRQGDLVKAGDTLVELETVSSSAELGELSVRLTALRFEMLHYQAEIDKKTSLEIPEILESAYPDLSREGKERFAARLQHLNTSLATQGKIVAQRGEDIQEIQERLVNLEKRHKLLMEQVAISAGLLKEGVETRYAHLELLKEGNQIESALGDNRIALARSRLALDEARSQLQQLRNTYDRDARESLDKERRQYDELSQRLHKYQDNVSRAMITSPVDGAVKRLGVITIGGVIPPGGLVAEIVPSQEGLLIEMQLTPPEIIHVEIGQKAIVRLSSPDAARFGELHGKVVFISPDTSVTNEGALYFTAHVITEQKVFAKKNRHVDLRPGVMTKVAIQTGLHTLFEYLMTPFLTQFNHALGEN